jgi:hypothetical protein
VGLHLLSQITKAEHDMPDSVALQQRELMVDKWLSSNLDERFGDCFSDWAHSGRVPASKHNRRDISYIHCPASTITG